MRLSYFFFNEKRSFGIILLQFFFFGKLLSYRIILIEIALELLLESILKFLEIIQFGCGRCMPNPELHRSCEHMGKRCFRFLKTIHCFRLMSIRQMIVRHRSSRQCYLQLQHQMIPKLPKVQHHLIQLKDQQLFREFRVRYRTMNHHRRVYQQQQQQPATTQA